jgi:hypothetical protein
MKTKLSLAAMIAAAAMIAMPVNSAQASHGGWHKRDCLFTWKRCCCCKKYYKKTWVKKAHKGKKSGKAK